MKIYFLASILLFIPMAFAGLIRKEPQASFKIIFDENEINSLQVGDTGLDMLNSENNTLVITSHLGNMEIKVANQSFVIESVPPPNNRNFLEDEPEIQNQNVGEKEKYEMVDDKSKTSTEQPSSKFDCMDSPLENLIIHCDGNVRLREFTESERSQAKERREKFEQDFENRMREMKEMRDRMNVATRLFEESFKSMRSATF